MHGPGERALHSPVEAHLGPLFLQPQLYRDADGHGMPEDRAHAVESARSGQPSAGCLQGPEDEGEPVYHGSTKGCAPGSEGIEVQGIAISGQLGKVYLICGIVAAGANHDSLAWG
ncbi:MAG: hypothetical protein A2559_11265 [Deltaproteobacteria bacterium RIFOXYD2_FULL_66_9]|nr:MAG: hypothetical protein A2559_11265 [Deltaproteobacteria bacterium RIFOXYD2_FULL_66_9]